MRVQTNMTRNVYTVDPETPLDEAFDLMRDGDVRHLPVVEGANLAGVLSERDILLRASYEDGEITVPPLTVADVMTTDVETCDMGSSIYDVAVAMNERKISCMPVTQGDELVGLVTSSDLIDMLAALQEYSAEQPLPMEFHVHRHRGEHSPRPWA